jgi:hypothetical protein
VIVSGWPRVPIESLFGLSNGRGSEVVVTSGGAESFLVHHSRYSPRAYHFVGGSASLKTNSPAPASGGASGKGENVSTQLDGFFGSGDEGAAGGGSCGRDTGRMRSAANRSPVRAASGSGSRCWAGVALAGR